MKKWLDLNRLLFLSVSIAALAVAGCGDDDDDGGNNGAGPSGDGAEITSDNAVQVQTALSSSIGAAVAKGPGTHNGAHSGKVKVDISTGKAAQPDLGNLGGLDISSLQTAFSLDFDNYSDDGLNWLDGTVNYSLAGGNFSYTADLTMSGQYEGKIKGSVDFNIETGQYSGSWDLGNGQTVSF